MKPNTLGVKIARYFLGVILLVFGLNQFFQFLPMPKPPEPALNFMSALTATGFMWYVIGIFQVISGIFLIIGRYVALGLVLFAPIALVILFYHLFLDPAGGLIGYVTFILEFVLLYTYLEAYKPMLKATFE
jgi:uncharacterized membrane protein YphA (DoxX/SURF4 family)